ncbi:MAG: hypothetical protein IAE67_01030 [Candidatus Competibacteraceae bacterium]|nr:hypothetical protein [Candidatus Competibacteraceae bacterium]
MKYISYIFSFFLLYMPLHAQDVWVADASIGIAIPIGNAAADDMSSPKSGFAGIGGAIRFYTALKPSKHLGFLVQLDAAMFQPKTGALSEYVMQQYGLNIQPTTTYYRYGAVHGGMFMSGIIRGDYWALDGRVTAGYMWAQSPMIEYRMGQDIYYKLYESNGGGVSFNAGFGARYKFWKFMFTSMAFDFVGAFPRFENVITETRVGPETQTSMNSYFQFIGNFIITGGIGISF